MERARCPGAGILEALAYTEETSGMFKTDLGLLVSLGESLDSSASPDGDEETEGKHVEANRRSDGEAATVLTVRDKLIQDLLRIRTKTHRTRFKLNRAQAEYSRACSS